MTRLSRGPVGGNLASGGWGVAVKGDQASRGWKVRGDQAGSGVAGGEWAEPDRQVSDPRDQA